MYSLRRLLIGKRCKICTCNSALHKRINKPTLHFKGIYAFYRERRIFEKPEALIFDNLTTSRYCKKQRFYATKVIPSFSLDGLPINRTLKTVRFCVVND